MDCECPLYTELIFTDKEKSVKAKKDMERDWARKGAVAELCLFCFYRKYKIKQNLNMEKYRQKNHIKL